MPETIQNVAIIAKINSVEAKRTAVGITELLIKKKVKVYSIRPLLVENTTILDAEEVRKIDLDLIFAIGGDGTTLRAFRIPPYYTPVFSINIGGNRGILSEFGIESLQCITESILSGHYFYDSRLRIQASIDGNVIPPALNDILFIRVSLTRTPLLSIGIMGDEIKQKMDGIIISTPTGSTGHSFSIGGPVMHESLNCLLLTPLASVNRVPFVVLPINDIAIKSSHDGALVIDGQETYRVIPGQIIRISRFPIDARFFRMKKKGTRQLAKLGFT